MYVCVPTWLDKCLQIAKRHFTFCGAVRKSCLRLIAKYDKRQERLDEHFPSELRGWSLEENTANKTGKTTLHWFRICFFFFFLLLAKRKVEQKRGKSRPLFRGQTRDEEKWLHILLSICQVASADNMAYEQCAR